MLLRLVAGMTPGEVAIELGRSVDAVHALQHRARRRLRRDLTQQGWAPRAMAA
jgi:RNA polymerase sigma-70 factor (ECF subfamily)